MNLSPAEALNSLIYGSPSSIITYASYKQMVWSAVAHLVYQNMLFKDDFEVFVVHFCSIEAIVVVLA